MPKKPLKKSAAMLVDVTNLLPLPEAAELAGVREQWLRKLVQAGRVKGVRIGTRYFVDREDAAAFERHPSRGRPRKGS